MFNTGMLLWLIEDSIETLGKSGGKLDIPSFTTCQSQLRPEKVEDTNIIANVQIHVERVIGNL